MHTDVQYDAAVLHSVTEIIDAPISLVYEIISDVRHWSDWQSSTDKTFLRGGVKKGSEFKWQSSGITFRALVHTAEAPCEFGWVAKSMWFRIVSNWTLEEHHGQTRVIIEESLSGLGAELLSNSMRNSLQLTMMEIKKYAESLILVSA